MKNLGQNKLDGLQDNRHKLSLFGGRTYDEPN